MILLSPFSRSFCAARPAGAIFFALAGTLLLLPALSPAALLHPAAAAAATGSRPGYIYDRAQVIDGGTESRMDSYMRRLDEATGAEIVIYTIPSFTGHGIKKDGIEIRDRDMLANYIFNEVPLDGVTGIGKEGKDNGVLVLVSLERDGSGGAMRIEIGRGLEGTITDGLAGEILDRHLVPAYREYEGAGSAGALATGLYDTARALGYYIAQEHPEAKRTIAYEAPPEEFSAMREKEAREREDRRTLAAVLIFGGLPGAALLLMYIDHKKNGRISRILRGVAGATPRKGFGWRGGGGGGGGGSGRGGGGRSGGGGAGR